MIMLDTLNYQELTYPFQFEAMGSENTSRPLVKSAYQKINFPISQPKQMLWVLKRTVSMRWFF